MSDHVNIAREDTDWLAYWLDGTVILCSEFHSTYDREGSGSLPTDNLNLVGDPHYVALA
jgi:hypothetical protein